jgi:polysaccharide export outer membrane protein
MTRSIPLKKTGRPGFRKNIASWALAVLILVPAQPPRAEDYVIGTGDVIEIETYSHPDLNTTAAVNEKGMISFPLIGQVQVNGLSTTAIAGKITSLLKDGYFVNPQVSVRIAHFREKQVSIMGKVNKPGIYDFSRSKTFLDLLSLAGGLAPRSGNRAIIKRKTGSTVIEDQTIVIDVRRLVEGGETFRDVELEDGDSIYVSEEEYFHVTGEVKSPGLFRLEEGITVSRAITLANSFTDSADRGKVTVVRQGGNGERIIEIGTGEHTFEMPVQKNDTVNVGKVGVYYVTGEVKKPGSYSFEKGTTVISAISRAGGFTAKAAKRRVDITRTGEEENHKTERVEYDHPVSPGDVIVVHERFF